MKWITIDENYLDYLRNNVEGRIPKTDYGTDKYKPFFGELFRIGNFSYITQITSKKPRLEKLKENKDFYKLYRGNKLIACVNLNYMFPVLTEDINYLINYNDVSLYRTFKSIKEKNDYISLLKYELSCINQKPIIISAKYLYENKYTNPDGKLAKRCLDYKNIEKYCLEYDIINKENKINKLNKLYDSLVEEYKKYLNGSKFAIEEFEKEVKDKPINKKINIVNSKILKMQPSFNINQIKNTLEP